MLKLERTSNDRQFNLIVRDQEFFLNIPLLTAFACAIAIHLVLFLVFQITPLKLRMHEQVYPPMIVQVDPQTAGAAVVAATSPLPQLKDNLPPIPPTTPVLAATPTFASMRRSDSIKQNQTSTNPFLHIEKDIYDLPIVSTPSKTNKSTIEIVISGPLSTSLLINNGVPSHFAALQNIRANQRVVYSVVADKASGKIVWYLLKESSKNNQLDKAAEKILLSMQFAKNTHDFTADGQIEIHFHTQIEGS